MSELERDSAIADCTGGHDSEMLVLGRITGLYGVRGWVKIFSETDPLENVLGFTPWYLGETSVAHRPVEGRRHGKGVVARLEGCENRDQASALMGLEIRVHRNQLPPPGAGEVYWADLEGLAVETLDGTQLGRVERLFPTIANDVVVVVGERERLIPFVWDDVIRDVDLERGVLRVDWDPDF